METTSRLTLGGFIFRILILSFILLITSLICLSIGSVKINIIDIFSILFNNQDNFLSQIILEIRLPRILYAIMVGGGLSIAGAVFQSLLMNPLAEPYILGISSGGTFGAILSFILGLSFIGTQFLAFAGSLSVMLIVFILGRRFGELEPNVLLLSGIMVGAFFSAAILLMMTLMNDSLRTAIFWLIGNLSLAEKNNLIFVIPVTILTSGILILLSNKFNVISLGSDYAKQLGINTKLLRNSSYILTSIMIGTLVSVSGIIGFVGLLIPHICRIIFGNDNRIVFTSSFFIGASYLTIADTIARTIISPAELPVGAITALIGAPVFIYLLKKRFNSTNQ
ncbi:MAG: iron ABC transporter permease [Melioribacter sp.]|uniref:FecCD family ABC transporter permease n=1 Tax=Rosettibacter primus TaxID=3111523 RepID=UPI00247C1A5B|nr:iron ABC transporter permease [Melioribacter sp.]